VYSLSQKIKKIKNQKKSKNQSKNQTKPQTPKQWKLQIELMKLSCRIDVLESLMIYPIPAVQQTKKIIPWNSVRSLHFSQIIKR